MLLSGTVIRGDGRGRELGFPTANLDVKEDVEAPNPGVYAGFASWDEKKYLAAIHIGPRPTFVGASATVEAHILDFDADIYGQVVTLDVQQKLREIVKFDTIEELQQAIAQDCEQVRAYLTLPS